MDLFFYWLLDRESEEMEFGHNPKRECTAYIVSKKLRYRLENRASASCFRYITMLLTGVWLLSLFIRDVWDF